MGCPHSLIGDASSCSQCRGAKPRAITIVEGVVRIDGVPQDRGAERETSAAETEHYRRGARARHRGHRKA